MKTILVITLSSLATLFLICACGDDDGGGGGGSSDVYHSCNVTNDLGHKTCSEFKNMPYVSMGESGCKRNGGTWTQTTCLTEEVIGVCTAESNNIAYTTRYYGEFPVADAKTACTDEENGAFAAQ